MTSRSDWICDCNGGSLVMYGRRCLTCKAERSPERETRMAGLPLQWRDNLDAIVDTLPRPLYRPKRPPRRQPWPDAFYRPTLLVLALAGIAIALIVGVQIGMRTERDRHHLDMADRGHPTPWIWCEYCQRDRVR